MLFGAITLSTASKGEQGLIPRHSETSLATVYRWALLDDVIPFWLKNGIDREQGGYFTAFDRDGAFQQFLEVSFLPGRMQPKVSNVTRPSQGIGPLMIGIATARSCESTWAISRSMARRALS